MNEREIAWTPERQETLQAALDGDLHFFNPGGLGGSYIQRGQFVHKPENKHPVRLLMLAQALVHGEHIMVGHQGRRRLRVTSKGADLLAKWRAKKF
jgi:cell wall-associated NlpC family hydrolase